MPEFENGRTYTLKVDVDALSDNPTGIPDFQVLCAVSISIAHNEEVDTFYRLCDEGFSQNHVNGLDSQYDVTVKGDKSDTTLQAVLSARYDIDKRNANSIQMTDDFTGETIECKAPITSMTDTREIPPVIEFGFTFKCAGKPTISQTV